MTDMREDAGRAQVELEAFLYPEPDWDAEPEPVQDAKEADALLWHVGQVDAELAEKERLAKDRKEAVDLWLRAERTRLGGRRAHLLTRLRPLQLELRERGTLSLKLLNGTLVSRKQQPAWKVTDTAQYLAWCAAHAPGLIRWKAEADADAYKAAFLPPDCGEDVQAAPINVGACVGAFLASCWCGWFGFVGDLGFVPGISVTVRGPKFEAVPS